MLSGESRYWSDPQAVRERLVALFNLVWILDVMSRMEEGDAAFANMLARLRTLDQMPMDGQLVENLGSWLGLARALAAERDGRPRQALAILTSSGVHRNRSPMS